MMNSLVFWFDGPPVCSKGVFNAVAEQWKSKVIFVVTRDVDDNRARIVSEKDNSYNKAEYVFLKERDELFVRSFIQEHIDDIHIFNGYVSNSSKYLWGILKHNKNAKIIIWLERIGYRGGKSYKMKPVVINMLQDIKHRYYAMRLRNRISALMPIGQKSIEAYRKLGWKKTEMLPFFYLPEMNEKMQESKIVDSKKVKFIYLGRFSAGWKGTDLLIEACKKINRADYSLEMVGGYGDYKDEVISYIKTNKNLHFGGTWKIDEACEKLNEYDVCIVPSRYEGWNPTVNEALMAGIGCITTTESVSDELVRACNAGMVVEPEASQIALAMEYAIEHPMEITQWKKNAYVYRYCMTADACAHYFIDCIEYVFGEVKMKPCLPWEHNK